MIQISYKRANKIILLSFSSSLFLFNFPFDKFKLCSWFYSTYLFVNVQTGLSKNLKANLLFGYIGTFKTTINHNINWDNPSPIWFPLSYILIESTFPQLSICIMVSIFCPQMLVAKVLLPTFFPLQSVLRQGLDVDCLIVSGQGKNKTQWQERF